MTESQQLMLFAAATPASPLALQESGKGLKIKDTSGQKCLELFALSGQNGLLPKMLLATLNKVLTPLSHKWNLKATPAGRLLFQLVPLVRHTEGIECGLWLTPTAMMPDETPASFQQRKMRNNYRNGTTISNLAMQVKYAAMPVLLPTPKVGGMEDATTVIKRKGHKAAMMHNLQAAVQMLPTPTNSEHKYRLQGSSQASKCLNALAGGKLNPQWVEWLMGFPIDHTALKP